MVIADALKEGTRLLSGVSDSAALDSHILLETACGHDRLFLIANRDAALSESERERFFSYLSRRMKGEPVAYIVGSKEFMGLPFTVKPGILIPRPDTETLVEYAIGHCRGDILDIGTGSGAIAVSLAHYLKDARLSACDVSREALDVAAENARRNDVSVRFFPLDLLTEDIPGPFDAIVSNPPYIRSNVIETLDVTVRSFEPRLALDGGDDGLIFYRALAKKAPRALRPGGRLITEIGFDQAEAVSALFAPFFSSVTVLRDLAGHDRVVIGIVR